MESSGGRYHAGSGNCTAGRPLGLTGNRITTRTQSPALSDSGSTSTVAVSSMSSLSLRRSEWMPVFGERAGSGGTHWPELTTATCSQPS